MGYILETLLVTRMTDLLGQFMFNAISKSFFLNKFFFLIFKGVGTTDTCPHLIYDNKLILGAKKTLVQKTREQPMRFRDKSVVLHACIELAMLVLLRY